MSGDNAKCSACGNTGKLYFYCVNKCALDDVCAKKSHIYDQCEKCKQYGYNANLPKIPIVTLRELGLIITSIALPIADYIAAVNLPAYNIDVNVPLMIGAFTWIHTINDFYIIFSNYHRYSGARDSYFKHIQNGIYLTITCISGAAILRWAPVILTQLGVFRAAPRWMIELAMLSRTYSALAIINTTIAWLCRQQIEDAADNIVRYVKRAIRPATMRGVLTSAIAALRGVSAIRFLDLFYTRAVNP